MAFSAFSFYTNKSRKTFSVRLVMRNDNDIEKVGEREKWLWKKKTPLPFAGAACFNGELDTNLALPDGARLAEQFPSLTEES